MKALGDLELAALLCSRVCHDVISPVGAIANGLEILADETDEEMRPLAFELVRRSEAQASAKLQFCRLAFGAAGASGSKLDLGEAGQIARLFVGVEKIKLDWSMPQEARDKLQVKLALNLMLMGICAIPRGGVVSVGEDGVNIIVTATGEGAKLPEVSTRLLAGDIDAGEIDARLVQVYYAMRLAEQAGYGIEADVGEGAVVITASTKGASDRS
jgi:histidine phosphotransferase ChpT